MNFLDLILGIPLLYGFYTGYTKGIFRQVAGIIGLFIAVFFGLKYSHFIGQLLSSVGVTSGKIAPILSFAIAFLLILIIINLAGKTLRKLSKSIGVGFFENLLGAFFGLLKFYLILIVFLFFTIKLNNKFEFFSPQVLKESVIYPYFEIGFSPLQNLWNKLIN
ncbi:CvpA family protein [Weeksellaceae bacterium TAE3-ERU29]|nr:CvpA family protein [Weeksellaceae bacterium TAE3-ERU29]